VGGDGKLSLKKRGAVEVLERGDDAVKVGPPDRGREPERLLPNRDRQVTDDREPVILPQALETIVVDAMSAEAGMVTLNERTHAARSKSSSAKCWLPD